MSMSVKSGRVSGAESSDEAVRQWHLAVSATGSAAGRYAEAGIDCAIDTYLLPDHLDLWSWTSEYRCAVVVLLPDVETAVKRNAKRVESTGWGVPEWQVRANHSAMASWHGHPSALIVDNSARTVAQVVDQIRRLSVDR